MNNDNSRIAIIKSGLGYGLGLLIGNIASTLLAANTDAQRFLGEPEAAALIYGVFLAFFIFGLGGFLGGAVGGYTLPGVARGKGRWGYMWHSGVAFGIGYGLLVFPVILIVSLLSFYDIASTPPHVFAIAFGLVGLIFGLLVGLSLGVWTTGRRFAPITRFAGLGFGVGGAVLGLTLWEFIFSVSSGLVEEGPLWLLLVGLFFFGGLGGSGLGYAYHRLARRAASEPLLPLRGATYSIRRRRVAIVAIAFPLVGFLIRPVMAAVGDLLTPVDAMLSPVLALETQGTHWLAPAPLASTVQPAALAAGPDGTLAAAWADGGELYLQPGIWDAAARSTTWEPAIPIGAGGAAAVPQVASDAAGGLHVAWTASDGARYARCTAEGCDEAVSIAPPATCERPPGATNEQPALTVSGNQVLLVWANDGLLPYAVWPVDAGPPRVAAGCVPVEGRAESPRLAPGAPELVYVAGETVYRARYAGAWETPEALGAGNQPEVSVAPGGDAHVAWCGGDGTVQYWHEGATATIQGGDCSSRPALALDDMGQVHILWQGTTVTKTTGTATAAPVLYESIGTADGWTPAALIAQTGPDAQPALAAAADGSLHAVWPGDEGVAYAAQVQYRCDPAALSPYGRVLYDIAREKRYAPPTDIVPFCENRYDRLLITPNPDPAYSDGPGTPNGAFDLLGDMIREARYEVLYSTMWYDPPLNDDSPGSVIAAAVADLYRSVQANPEQYPRGMTVRIMLGNPPELAVGQLSGQLWTLIDDLRRAGVDKMVDETTGWRLEVADYEGNLPHSHVKTIIIDGKTAAANGFNMTYDHLPVDHPSGQGSGRFDLGLQVTGPVVQATQRMFDDMWAGADQRVCANLTPPASIPWQVTCNDRTAVADHVPEVQRFFLAGGSESVFSLYRSRVHDQADQQTIAALSAAQESVDATHVNFSLDMVCNLNVIFNVCDADISPEYVGALLQAAQNGAEIRLLVKPGPVEGIENNVALSAIIARFAELGLEDQLTARYFDGPVHAKAALVDDQLLIVGSQNFHYSAYGSGSGLNEYSYAVEDERAVADFRDAFAFHWERAEPVR